MYFSERWKDFTSRRMKKQFGELFPLSVKKREEIKGWNFEDGFGKKEVETGFEWDFKRFPVIFSTKIRSSVEPGELVLLDVWTGGESLVKVDGSAYGEINEFHRQLDFTKFCDGSEHSVEIRTVPKGLFGTTNFSPKFEKAYKLVLDGELYRSFLRFKFAFEIFEAAEDHVKEEIYSAFMKALGTIDVPSSTGEYFDRLTDDPTMESMTKSWDPPAFPVPKGVTVDDARRNKMIGASEWLMESVADLSKKYVIPYKVFAAGHAHIDYAWLWPLKETKRKFVRTFANAVRMLEKYPEFRFIQSSSAYYEDLKEIDPDLFGRVKKFAEEGRWEVTGGSVVEFDANMTSGESLARQFLYGQRFFESEFGKRSKISLLPDSFGFTWGLPQIMKDSGIKYFLTTKLGWNDKNEFPHDWFAWRGLDGSEVVAHVFKGIEGYNAPLTPGDLRMNLESLKRSKGGVPFSLLTFGYGDGGGGPTDEMMERYGYIKETPALPALGIKNFEKLLEETEFGNLPVVDDELYLEFHRGTYTNQARVKKLNREMENLLYTAEVLASCDFIGGNEYPKGSLTKAWKTLNRAQFHDVLPGSSIAEVYEEFNGMLEEEKKVVKGIAGDILKRNSSPAKDAFSLFNPSNLALPVLVRSETGIEEGFYGGAIVQKGADGRTYIVGGGDLGRLGPTVFEKTEFRPAETVKAGENFVDNSVVRVEVRPDGALDVTDGRTGRKLFKNGIGPVMYRDVPAEFEAWDVSYDSEKRIELSPKTVSVFDEGPATASLRLEYEFEGTKFGMVARIYGDREIVDFQFDADWHTRRYLLKLEFDANLLSREAIFETAFGMIKRKTTRNNSLEEAKFEVPHHRWMDISQDDFGISVINDGKYGSSVFGTVVGVSLLRGAISSDFHSDEGRHEFTVSILPHAKEWKEKTLAHAALLNLPVPATNGRMKDISGKMKNLFEERGLVLSALKMTEGGKKIAVRLYEPFGRDADVKFARPVKISNILEDEIVGGVKEIRFRPFEVKTFVIDLFE